MNSSTQRCYIDFAAGDRSEYDREKQQHDDLVEWLASHGAGYGLATSLDELDDVGRESLASIIEEATQISITPSLFSPPPSLLLPRLTLLINTSSSLKKTSENFIALLSDERKLLSKRSPHRPLKYAGSVVHRIEKGFIAQGGDLTRGDGSGGESIYGGTFNDEKEGLKTPFEFGTIGMANSGKNSNTSQFFLTLTSDPVQLKKLTGKYVAFGRAELEGDQSGPSSRACLERLDGFADGRGGTRAKVWIEKCGLF